VAIDPITGESHVKSSDDPVHKVVLTDEEGRLASTAGKGAQVRIFDSSGNPVDSFGGGGGVDPVGLKNIAAAQIDPATEQKQDSAITQLTSIAGKDFATQTTLAALLTELQLKADLTETQPVSAASLPLPAGAATEATLASLLTEATFNAEDFATQATLAICQGILTSIASINGGISATLSAINLTTGIKKIVDELPAGTQNIGDVDIASALPAGSNNIGDVDIASALPAGDNNIGNVDVVTLPSIPAGSNNIGDVDVLTVPQSDNFDPVLTKTEVKKTVDFTASQTAQTIWDPTAGTSFVLTSFIISFSAQGDFHMFDNTDTTANRIAKFYGEERGGGTHSWKGKVTGAADDNILKYTTGAGCAGSITVFGYEVDQT
jgi:hypothetical protein